MGGAHSTAERQAAPVVLTNLLVWRLGHGTAPLAPHLAGAAARLAVLSHQPPSLSLSHLPQPTDRFSHRRTNPSPPTDFPSGRRLTSFCFNSPTASHPSTHPTGTPKTQQLAGQSPV